MKPLTLIVSRPERMPWAQLPGHAGITPEQFDVSFDVCAIAANNEPWPIRSFGERRLAHLVCRSGAPAILVGADVWDLCPPLKNAGMLATALWPLEGRWRTVMTMPCVLPKVQFWKNADNVARFRHWFQHTLALAYNMKQAS